MIAASSQASRRGATLGAIAALGLGAAWLLPLTVSWNIAPDLGHSWAVPLLMAYLWWERWGERPPAIARARLGMAWWWLALAIGAMAIPLRLLLTPFPMWPLLLAAYTGLLAGVALLAAWIVGGGPAVRWTAGPLILVVSALPAPSLVESSIIIPLRSGMAVAAAELSNWLGHPAIAVGTSVQLSSGWVGIDEACGGIRSLQACIMIGLFFGEWYRFSWPRRGWLVAAGIAVALMGNFARVLFLSLRVNAGTESVQSVHDLAGWLAMGASLLATGWLACRWAGYTWPQQAVRRGDAVSPPRNWSWALAVVAFLAATEIGTRLWFSHGEAARANVAQWTVRFPEEHWSFRDQPLNEAGQEMLRPDTFKAGRWQPEADRFVAAYYVEWRRGQVARFVPFLHNPTVCMPLSGCELVASLDPIAIKWAGGEIPFHVYRFRRAGEDMVVGFTIWDPTRGAPLQSAQATNSWWEWWKSQWTEVAEARQHQPAQLLTVSVISPLDPAADLRTSITALLAEVPAALAQ